MDQPADEILNELLIQLFSDEGPMFGQLGVAPWECIISVSRNVGIR